MYARQFMPRSDGPLEIPEDRYISRVEIENIIMQELSGGLEANFGLNSGLYIADLRYYCPPHRNAKNIIENSKIRRMTVFADEVRTERFDCDDFSLLLKARFAYAGYRDPSFPNATYCFGVVWGMLPFPFPHSLNWMITVDEHEEKSLWFVEPQTYDVFRPRSNDKNIYFMLV